MLSCAAIMAGALVTASVASSAATHHRGGPVDVLYAGSLVGLMDKASVPPSTRRPGTRSMGFSAGSDALATEIKGRRS